MGEKGDILTRLIQVERFSSSGHFHFEKNMHFPAHAVSIISLSWILEFWRSAVAMFTCWLKYRSMKGCTPDCTASPSQASFRGESAKRWAMQDDGTPAPRRDPLRVEKRALGSPGWAAEADDVSPVVGVARAGAAFVDA